MVLGSSPSLPETAAMAARMYSFDHSGYERCAESGIECDAGDGVPASRSGMVVLLGPYVLDSAAIGDET